MPFWQPRVICMVGGIHTLLLERTANAHQRHSGAMRSIEPGISRFRVWCWRTIPE